MRYLSGTQKKPTGVAKATAAANLSRLVAEKVQEEMQVYVAGQKKLQADVERLDTTLTSYRVCLVSV